MSNTAIAWEPQQTPAELHEALRTLGEHYPIVEGRQEGAVQVAFAADAGPAPLRVERSDGAASVRYSRVCQALRAVGALLAGTVSPGSPCREQSPFESFGIMLDCSRNGVMKPEHFESWLRKLSLMGYNLAMLYTEDTYEIAGEPAFGHLRGRYTPDELRRLDDYAARLGIEMIGCIQALGHLAQVLKRPVYRNVRDTASVLLVDGDATYALIDKMLATFADVFRSRRIHVGMDETHDLGRGRFMDQFGYQRGYDLFNRHLARVVELCDRRGLQPMLWSDMYFRMGSKEGGYYDPQCVIPDDVKDDIPRQAQLVYWDYYHDNEAFYQDWIARHRALGFDPVMGSGVWTWRRLWYDLATTEANAAPCIRACRDAGIKEFFFTLWGDDGAYCEFDSALAGLAYGAELAYAGDVDARRLADRFAAICHVDYDVVALAAEINPPDYGAPVLWDDPLLGLCWNERLAEDKQFWAKALEKYNGLLERLSPHAETTEPMDVAHLVSVVRCLLAKVELRMQLDAAYASRDRAALTAVGGRIPQVIEAVDEVLASFRRQWYRRNKPHGFETIQIRLGGLRQRYLELRQRIEEFVAGEIDGIAELDEPAAGKGAAEIKNWRTIAAAGLV